MLYDFKLIVAFQAFATGVGDVGSAFTTRNS